MKENKEKRN